MADLTTNLLMSAGVAIGPNKAIPGHLFGYLGNTHSHRFSWVSFQEDGRIEQLFTRDGCPFGVALEPGRPISFPIPQERLFAELGQPKALRTSWEW